MKLKLKLLDRLVILNTILPATDTIENMRLKKSIAGKLRLTTNEERLISYEASSGMIRITSGAILENPDIFNTETEYCFTEMEGLYIGRRAQYASSVGMVQLETLDTFEKIFEATKGLEAAQPSEPVQASEAANSDMVMGTPETLGTLPTEIDGASMAGAGD
jgi:hypothetical protein